MALTFHRTDKAAARRLRVVSDEGVPALRTAEGETIHFEGASPEEMEAKVEDFLAWAS